MGCWTSVDRATPNGSLDKQRKLAYDGLLNGLAFKSTMPVPAIDRPARAQSRRELFTSMEYGPDWAGSAVTYGGKTL